MSKPKPVFALFVVIASAVFAFGAKKEKIEHAPLPTQVTAAKTVYIQNQTDQPGVADKAYTQLKQWGRYAVVDSKEKADLVIVFTFAYSHTERDNSDYVNLYNSSNGSYTSGVVPGGTSTITWNWTQIRLVDPKTGEVMWADERVWRRKHSATDELMQALRQRVEEQDKVAAR